MVPREQHDSKEMGRPDPNDVLAFWRWHSQVVQWACAAETFQQFWDCVESCQPLQLLCEPGVYDPFPLHGLLYTLQQMFHENTYFGISPRPLREGRVGRPRHQVSPWFGDREFGLCMLDLVVYNIVGPKGKHWRLCVDLLRHFFPDRYPPAWGPANLRGRVNHFLRKHRLLARREFQDTYGRKLEGCLSEELARHIERHPVP